MMDHIKDLLEGANSGSKEDQYKIGTYYLIGVDVAKNQELAIYYLTESANQNYELAQERLADIYLENHDIKSHINWLEKSALNNNSRSQFKLAGYYFLGENIETNYEKTLMWLQKSVEDNHDEAIHQLAIFYETGTLVDEDISQALQLYKKAREYKYLPSIFKLGEIYGEGLLVEKDLEQAMIYFNEAIELESVATVSYLGYAYSQGIMFKQDYKIAYEYFLLAASYGDLLAMTNLGVSYLNGDGVEKNIEEGLKWYFKAAEQDSTVAYNALGGYYLSIDDTKESFKWYKKSADKNDAIGYYNIGNFFIRNTEVSNREMEGIEYLEQSAHSGYELAQLFLGHIYYNGMEFVTQDYFESYKWYEMAAQSGEPEGMFQIYMMLESGIGVDENPEEAKYWLETAADLEHDKAISHLGNSYMRGELHEMDYEIGFHWHEIAAKMDVAESQNALANIYYHGFGVVPVNLATSIKWRKKAANNNDFQGMFGLALSYELGIGVKQSDEDALGWYFKSLEIRTQSISKHHIGLIYYKKKSKFHDETEALKWLTEAAQEGFAPAISSLGEHEYFLGNYEKSYQHFSESVKSNDIQALFYLGFFHDQGLYVEENIEEAIRYYELAAKEGSNLALYNLGQIYYHDIKVPKNIDYAMENYYKAAELDYAPAMVKIGNDFESRSDYIEARKWFKKAYEFGDENAFFQLAYYYSNGLGGKKNIKKAIEMYEKISESNEVASYNLAQIHFQNTKYLDIEKGLHYCNLSADKGYVEAINYLGSYYEKLKDYEKSFSYFFKSANLNNPLGLFKYGYYYDNGFFVEKNITTAVDYYKRSADLGDLTAMHNLGVIYSREETQDFKLSRKYYKMCASNDATCRLYYARYLFYGKGGNQDIDQGFHLIDDVKKTEYRAYYFLTYIYLSNEFKFYNFEKAINSALKYLEYERDENIMLIVANHYFDTNEFEKSFAMYKKLLSYYNNQFAVTRMTYQYSNGLGVIKNEVEAKKLAHMKK